MMSLVLSPITSVSSLVMLFNYDWVILTQVQVLILIVI